ncbi:MAG TPA: BamA/TamA family outer membrane protein [Caulobacteraceae bacterium]
METSADDLAPSGEAAPAAIDKTAEAAKHAHGLLAVPIPIIDPQIGDGLIPVGSYFYSPVKGGRPWVTGVAGLYTSKKDWALGVAQQADLMDGRLRVLGLAGYGQFYLDFFGTGVAAGATGRSIKLNQNGEGVLASVLYDFIGKGHLYTGLRYQGVRINTSVATQLSPDILQTIQPFPGLPPIPPVNLPSKSPVLKTTDSLLGPAFEYDTRNSEFMPTKGVYIEGHWLVGGHALGSTFDYNKLQLAANGFIPLDKNTVLALRAIFCRSSDGAPFYDLCLYGTQHDLRGYEGGRYRDHAMEAAQVEIRRHLFWRIGAVAFGGFGGVAPTVGGLFATKPLPAGGVGLRFQPVKTIPVNMSVDYAWGVDSHALYLYLRDAF